MNCRAFHCNIPDINRDSMKKASRGTVPQSKLVSRVSLLLKVLDYMRHIIDEAVTLTLHTVFQHYYLFRFGQLFRRSEKLRQLRWGYSTFFQKYELSFLIKYQPSIIMDKVYHVLILLKQWCCFEMPVEKRHTAYPSFKDTNAKCSCWFIWHVSKKYFFFQQIHEPYVIQTIYFLFCSAQWAFLHWSACCQECVRAWPISYFGRFTVIWPLKYQPEKRCKLSQSPVSQDDSWASATGKE